MRGLGTGVVIELTARLCQKRRWEVSGRYTHNWLEHFIYCRQQLIFSVSVDADDGLFILILKLYRPPFLPPNLLFSPDLQLLLITENS
jgi:hypothetical protein